MKITQNDFSGGMSALTDVTKPAEATYRQGFNVRIRRNAIEPAYRHVKINSPTALHQAIFANDNQLGLIAAGQIYRVKLDTDICVPMGGSGTLSAVATRVYHKAIPAPTNWLVDSTYQPTISTQEECIVLQDGVNQPTLLFSDFSSRPAGTYADWTFESPEYIPIGTFMAYSGNKLFVANGKDIYQSVSGRPTDFVLNISNDGTKQGTADTTKMLVTAASLTAIVASQQGGLLAFTRYAAYALTPDPQLPTFFGELGYQPSDVFPVGAVNDLAFTFSNGESLFVSPNGINSFNQVLQIQRASNNTPYGSKIVDYLIRPIAYTATAVVNDYTFIALDTIFGPAILVHDNILNCYAGFDLTLGAVKEFATIEDDGLTRLFYITDSGLYEIPQYAGNKATGLVYIGEYSTSDASKHTRITHAHLGFNYVRAEGEIGVELFTDKVLNSRNRVLKTLSYQQEGVGLFEATPQRIPIALDMQATGLSFDFTQGPAADTNGLLISIGADARLVSVTVNVETLETRAADMTSVANSPDEVYLYGAISPTTINVGSTQYDVTIGQKYVLYAFSSDETLTNGDQRITAKSGKATIFTARSEIVFTSTTAFVYDYSNFLSILQPSSKTIILSALGDLDNPYPLQAILQNAGVNASAVLGQYELLTPTRAKSFYSAFNSYSMMRVEYPNANFFLFSDVVSDLPVNGPAMSWLQGQVAAYGVDKFNICCFARAPYTSKGTAGADLRWPFEDLGVKLVISSTINDTGYCREFVNGVHYITNAAANEPVPNGVKLIIAKNLLQGYYGPLDEFTIPL